MAPSLSPSPSLPFHSPPSVPPPKDQTPVHPSPLPPSLPALQTNQHGHATLPFFILPSTASTSSNQPLPTQQRGPTATTPSSSTSLPLPTHDQGNWDKELPDKWLDREQLDTIKQRLTTGESVSPDDVLALAQSLVEHGLLADEVVKKGSKVYNADLQSHRLAYDDDLSRLRSENATLTSQLSTLTAVHSPCATLQLEHSLLKAENHQLRVQSEALAKKCYEARMQLLAQAEAEGGDADDECTVPRSSSRGEGVPVTQGEFVKLEKENKKLRSDNRDLLNKYESQQLICQHLQVGIQSIAPQLLHGAPLVATDYQIELPSPPLSQHSQHSHEHHPIASTSTLPPRPSLPVPSQKKQKPSRPRYLLTGDAESELLLAAGKTFSHTTRIERIPLSLAIEQQAEEIVRARRRNFGGDSDGEEAAPPGLSPLRPRPQRGAAVGNATFARPRLSASAGPSDDGSLALLQLAGGFPSTSAQAHHHAASLPPPGIASPRHSKRPRTRSISNRQNTSSPEALFAIPPPVPISSGSGLPSGPVALVGGSSSRAYEGAYGGQDAGRGQRRATTNFGLGQWGGEEEDDDEGLKMALEHRHLAMRVERRPSQEEDQEDEEMALPPKDEGYSDVDDPSDTEAPRMGFAPPPPATLSLSTRPPPPGPARRTSTVGGGGGGPGPMPPSSSRRQLGQTRSALDVLAEATSYADSRNGDHGGGAVPSFAPAPPPRATPVQAPPLVPKASNRKKAPQTQQQQKGKRRVSTQGEYDEDEDEEDDVEDDDGDYAYPSGGGGGPSGGGNGRGRARTAGSGSGSGGEGGAASKKARLPYSKWTVEEDEALIKAVTQVGMAWDHVAKLCPTRQYHQVRQRFLRGLKSGQLVDKQLKHLQPAVIAAVADFKAKKQQKKQAKQGTPG